MRLKLVLLLVASSAVNAASKPEILEIPAQGNLDKQSPQLSLLVIEPVEAKLELVSKSKLALKAAVKAKESLAVKNVVVEKQLIP